MRDEGTAASGFLRKFEAASLKPDFRWMPSLPLGPSFLQFSQSPLIDLLSSYGGA
jgi:hypothetical protein